jgi:hypothetical protein
MVESIKFLSIGNSFSDDAMDHAYDILHSLGVKNIKLGNLYVGGCSLTMHMNHANGDLPVYDYRVNTDGKWVSKANATLSEGILDEEWDIITFQQVSGESGIPECYAPLDDFMAYVRKLAKGNPKFAWHMTWAYANGSEHPDFPRYDRNQDTMYASIVDTVQKLILPRKEFFTVIPAGTAIQNMRTSYLGDTLNRDKFHLTFGLGRYAAGLAFVKALFDLDISNIEFEPEGVTEKERKTAVKAVEYAVAQPFKVTSMA